MSLSFHLLHYRISTLNKHRFWAFPTTPSWRKLTTRSLAAAERKQIKFKQLIVNNNNISISSKIQSNLFQRIGIELAESMWYRWSTSTPWSLTRKSFSLLQIWFSRRLWVLLYCFNSKLTPFLSTSSALRNVLLRPRCCKMEANPNHSSK